MVTLGILGGTFDPIHYGHLGIAKAVYAALNLEKIIFAPVGSPPHKQQRRISDAEHRWQMARRAVTSLSWAVVSRVDIDRPGPQFSVDTVRLLQNEFSVGEEETCFIIGADVLRNFLSWYRAADLVAQCRFAVVHRPGVQPDVDALVAQLPQLASRLIWVEMPPIAISGTEIRRRVACGESVAGMVPPAVEEYISAHRLYADTHHNL